MMCSRAEERAGETTIVNYFNSFFSAKKAGISESLENNFRHEIEILVRDTHVRQLDRVL